eukprot:TRINITY_DN102945_c0_g1_i1.p2 TRINITY_DN102945_c0_g1~~TRINITY_DN102945_c0_g1_i1.p2  ORF type:complete len:305 (-),score=143.12 TRINITY_DN102945_c0_g1_i1:39-953(-)
MCCRPGSVLLVVSWAISTFDVVSDIVLNVAIIRSSTCLNLDRQQCLANVEHECEWRGESMPLVTGCDPTGTFGAVYGAAVILLALVVIKESVKAFFVLRAAWTDSPVACSCYNSPLIPVLCIAPVACRDFQFAIQAGTFSVILADTFIEDIPEITLNLLWMRHTGDRTLQSVLALVASALNVGWNIYKVRKIRWEAALDSPRGSRLEKSENLQRMRGPSREAELQRLRAESNRRLQALAHSSSQDHADVDLVIKPPNSNKSNLSKSSKSSVSGSRSRGNTPASARKIKFRDDLPTKHKRKPTEF